VALLREYRAATIYKANADYLFSTASGGPVAWNNVDKSLRSIVKRSGIREPWPTFHDCRHTFASLLIAEGVNVKDVSKALGHSDAGFTLRTYVGLFDKEGSAERIRGNWQVTQPLGNEPDRAGGQVLSFPANPHSSETPAAQSG
jgi:integrase